MEDETFEPVERERKPEEEIEELPPKKRGMLKIAAVIVAILLAGILVWYFVFSNSPPSPAFTAESDDLHLSVDASGSTDPDGNIASYSWNWGDPGSSAPGSGVSATHDYAAEGNYNVVLTVTDARGAAMSLSKSIPIQIRPVAAFIARTERMTASFDASSSISKTGGQITSYAWDFGDGATGTGVQPTHLYANPGKKTVTLRVTDASGRTGDTQRFVSPADTTVDILLTDFFTAGCPYGDFWPLRNGTYGDFILEESAPCTDFYPWVLITAKDPVTGQTLGKVNPSWVYGLFRFDALVRNHPGYDLTEPVILPIFNPSVQPDPTSFIRMNVTFDYMGSTLLDEYSSGDFAVDQGLSDGFGYLVRGNVTMDLTESKRVFGVVASTPAEAQQWWYDNTRYGAAAGAVESRTGQWLSNDGNGKYDIFNGFEFYFQADITDLNATVASDGTTRIQVFWDGTGLDVLLGRWFYWGNASYLDAVCTQGNNTPFAICNHPTRPYGAVQPEGWLPMEECFCETATINATITRTSMDLDYNTIMEYVFSAAANPGPDGFYGTSDDLPGWSFDPILFDYVPREGSGSPGSEGYPNSELRWYEGLTAPIPQPGSYSYGKQYEYLNAPVRWRFDAGSTLTLVMPRTPVIWYDPVGSKWNPNTLLGDYVAFESPMTLRLVKVDGRDLAPGTLYLWDHRAKVVSMAGPYDYGTTSMPLVPSPHIEFRPETGG